MSRRYNLGSSRWTGGAALAVAALLCLPAAFSQHNSGPVAHPATAAHAPAPQPSRQPTARPQPARPQAARPQGQPAAQPQLRSQGASQGNFQQYQGQRPVQGSVPSSARPAYPGPPYLGQGYARPAYPGYAPPAETPPGHLGAWLNDHRNLPVQDQERILRSDPSFKRIPPADQQRLVQQLHQVNQLTEEQRQLRLQRMENLERLSPQQRMQINISQRRWATLQPDRQALMKNAFRDLRSVPVEQRPTVLNSSRYQGVFSPEERGILSDMLRIEPYQPAR